MPRVFFMIYKIKTLKELQKTAYFYDNSLWVSIEEADRWEKSHSGFFSVIEPDEDMDVFGNVVTNDPNIVGSGVVYWNEDEYEDDDFELIFKWASEYTITQETNPEYFL